MSKPLQFTIVEQDAGLNASGWRWQIYCTQGGVGRTLAEGDGRGFVRQMGRMINTAFKLRKELDDGKEPR